MKPIVLHISNDFPDLLAPNKTRAVINLVEGTPEFRHVVYSLNRVNGWSGIASRSFGEDRTEVVYHALPKGLFWESRLREVADWIAADLKQRAIVPDLIEAHKFTIEGLIGLQLADHFGKPLVCDIQGKTDAKILKAKPGLRLRYRQIAARSSLVFSYSPWPLPLFRQLVGGLDAAKCRLLPVVPAIDTLSPAPVIAENRLLTVFNLDGWQNKNLRGVMAAMKTLTGRFPDLSLDVYGGGRADSLQAVVRAVRSSGVANRVNVCGDRPNGKLPETMKRYAAFVMPSQRETYGLVYAESLFAGLPVLFSKDRGIDGYFDEKSIGYACNPFAVADIADGIAHVLTHQVELKQSIARLHETGGLNKIRKAAILEVYRTGLEEALRT